MEKKLIFTGKTVEEAIEAGLTELSLSRDEVDVEVLEEGKKRLLGKSSPAEVKLTVKNKQSDGERAVKFLEGLFEVLGLEAVPVLESEEEKILINLSAVGEKNVIGRRGEIIDAIQTLAGAVANTGRREYKRVVVDYEDYRSRREETLKHVAEKLAQKAVRLGKKMRLEPMNPYERRIIHAALMENPDVTTKSEGKEPARFVVIIPKNLRKSDDRNHGKGGRNGGKFNRDRNNRSEKQYPKRELPAEDTPQT
ncbi:MAG: protein jag, partial [Clostridiales bacterium]|nr:protein jag [Clostridiales bacterium]